MAKIIEAKAVITADDKTGAVFDKVAKKIDQIAKSGKAAAAVDQLAKAMERAKSQMQAIDRFNASRGGFADARSKFNATQIAVTQAAQAMKRGEGDARQLARAYDRAQAAVSSASRAFEQQRNALLANKRAMETLGVPVSQAASHQARLRAAVDRTTEALRRQERASERSQMRRTAVAGAAAYAGHLAAHGVRHGASESLRTYREFDKERRFGKVVMGLTDEQQKPLVNQAIHMGATTKYNDVQVLHAQRDLAARGLKMDQVMGVIEPAANLGQSLDLDLPSAVKQVEGSLFGFKRDISTRESAVAAARRTADMQVAAAKASGMTPEDLVQLYKYGATPSRLAGLSEGSLLAFGGVAKKANIGGDESGVAFRQLVASLTKPTYTARTAMLANGLNFKNYQRMRSSIEVDPFAQDVAATYGVNLDKKTKAGLGKIFTDKDIISDPAKFAPAVMSLLKGSLGGRDAKSLKSIAGAANRYRAASVESIDSNAILRDLLLKLPGNLQLANSIFGPKQGGRIATALGDPETLKHILDIVDNKSDGRAEEIAKERMAGFDGAVSRFEGATKNLETAIGRAFDRDGKGGALTWGTNALGKGVQWLAERSPGAVAGGAVAAGAAGLGLAGFTAAQFLNILTTGGGLTTSATLLTGAAGALTNAAVVLSGGKATGAIGGAATAGAGAAAAKTGIWGKVAMGSALLGLAGLGIGAYYMAEGANEDAGITRDSTRARQRRQAAKYNWWGLYSPKANLSAMPELSPTMTFGTGVNGDKGPATATLTGSAEVHGEAKIIFEASSSLIQIVRQAEQAVRLIGTLTPNGAGSTGKSSPDAVAPAIPYTFSGNTGIGGAP